MFLGAMGAISLLGRAHASTESAPRIAALDWVSGQNLLALGLAPIAMPDLERYATLVVEPAASARTRELGLRSEPNLELVDWLRPDLIVTGTELGVLRERLLDLAPLLSIDTDNFGAANRLDFARHALSSFAGRIGSSNECSVFLQSVDEEFYQAYARLRKYDGRPLFVATIIDGRRMLVFGKNSLFQAVLNHFGIENAWSGYTSRYGHTTVNVDRLAERPEARLLCVGDTSSTAIKTLLSTPVIASLPFVRERRIAFIPDVLFYGGLPPARRFARLASLALSTKS